jgi:hypothetical protein
MASNASDSYADLGATITAPKADLNLGIHLYVDGAAVHAVQLDTSKAGDHTIDYVVTGHSGLTSTSTRTVIVSAPATGNAPTTDASSALPAVNDNPAAPLSATATDATTTAQ